MAQYGAEYGNQKSQYDEYGNPVRQTDEYGNPARHGGTMGDYGTTGTTGAYGGTTGAHGTYATGTTGTTGTGAYATQPGTDVGKEHHGLGGMLHRSGSGSSSSVRPTN